MPGLIPMAKSYKTRFLSHLLLSAATGIGGSISANSESDISGLRTWREVHFQDPNGLGAGNNRADPDKTA